MEKSTLIILAVVCIILFIAPLIMYSGHGEDDGYFGGADDVAAEVFVVDLILDGLETVGPEFLGTQSDLVLDGDDLQDHVNDPDDPQQMEQGRAAEEVQTLQNAEPLRTENTERAANDENQTATDQANDVIFSCFGHKCTPLYVRILFIICQILSFRKRKNEKAPCGA